MSLAGFADGYPFVVSLQGGVTPGDPVAFAGALVVFGTALPAVIRRFVVVPDGDQRRGGTQGLQACICMVLGIALAVVGEADDLPVGLETTAAGGVFSGAVAAGTVFVDVVTNVKPSVIGIGSVDRCRPGVGIELLGRWEVGTRENSQPHRITSLRQRLGLAHGRDLITGAEAVVVGGVGNEAFRFYLDGPIAVGGGCEAAAAFDGFRSKVGTVGNLPLHILLAEGPIGRADPSPEDYRICVGVTRGNTVGKEVAGCRHGVIGAGSPLRALNGEKRSCLLEKPISRE